MRVLGLGTLIAGLFIATEEVVYLAALRRIVGQLDALPARWAIVGGFAVSARSELAG